MEVTLGDLRGGYLDLLDRLLLGRSIVSRGLATRELTNATLVFPDPLAPLLPIGVGRSINLRFAAIETLSLIGGYGRADLLARAAPGYDRVLLDRDHPDYGAYGPRLTNQLGACVDLLAADPGTRRAVATVWREEDLMHDGDRPCTLTLQFLTRPAVVPLLGSDPDQPTLELHVTMRSQDAWLGVPYDCFMFGQLQHTVARELRLPAGRYVHHATSLHVYERDVERIETLLRDRPGIQDDVDDLPLGVVGVDVPDRGVGADRSTGFDVAAYLLDDLDMPTPTSTEVERAGNAWYVAQLERLRVGEDAS